ncbi:hypothetical protein ACTI_22420 [Actinoplanes sp. OR16]|uniref:hypothetical protein n=1 Tax=Actinoplanes sp. OR16 TaxID=946334 RepID=UPI000F6C7410|nr:hypothetical protein [Actinoplanes sp. OR16]BBH65557.1 hypothetical protein ACTI_22420 [Actinoplanes sp. OR16]
MSVLTGRIATTASAVLLAVCGCPLPATAAPTSPTVTARFQQVTLAPGGDGQEALLWASIDDGGTAGYTTIDYTVDYSGIASFAEVELTEAYENLGTGGWAIGQSSGLTPSSDPSNGGCDLSGTTFTCSTAMFTGTGVPFFGLSSFGINPLADAAAGASGTVTVTAKAGDGPETTSESQVRIGEGVDLAAVEIDPIEAAAGESTPVQSRVRNAGSTVADGVMLYVGASQDLLIGDRYKNCRYGKVIVCTFDATLQPGTTYELAEPFTMHPPADAIGGSTVETEVTWTTVTEWDDLLASWPDELIEEIFGVGEAGTGGDLELTEVVSVAGEPQVEQDYTDNDVNLTATVTGGEPADFAAIGAEVKAAADSTVPVRVGLVNNGPGRLYPDLFDNNNVLVGVALPPHTYLDWTESECDAWDQEQQFLCVSDAALKPGGRAYFDLDVRVEKKPGEDGSVRVQEIADSGTTGNDAAAIRISVAGGEASLPITGPTGLLVVGAFLLAAGGIGRYLARRRPTSDR